MKVWTRRAFIPALGAGIVSTAFITASTDYKTVKAADTSDLIRPKRLFKGACIGICAPAGALRRSEEVDMFKSVLEAMGFQVKVGKYVYEKHGFFAGTDAQRAEDFMDLITDEEVDGIFFLRGGWGCARVLPLLDFNSIKAHPKIVMGFSDATSLLNAITSRTGLVTFHGPSGNSTWNTFSIESLQEVLQSGEPTTYDAQQNDEHMVTYAEGKATGVLWGGNLSVITSMLGTPYFPEISDGLLFLEEVGEEPYRIDRMLTQLKQAGIFNRCNGIVLGSFRKCIAEEPDRAFTLEEVFEDHFGNLHIPVFYGAPIGHTRDKFTIPIGVEATMDAKEGTIALTTSAVK
jgi:muramoyltetrapeptide carboxypeptidase